MKPLILIFALALTGCATTLLLLISNGRAKCVNTGSCRQVGRVSQFFRRKISEAFGSSVAGNLSAPPVLAFHKIDPSQPRFASTTNRRVLFILLVSSFSKVCHAVIKAVAINMVNLPRRMCPKHIKPCESMGLVQFPRNPDLGVLIAGADIPSHFTNNYSVGGPGSPSENTSVWAVVKNFAQTLCGKIGLSHDTVPSLIGQRLTRVSSACRPRYFSALAIPFAILSGCASTTDYEQYARSAEAASVARSAALADIAKSGDSGAKIAAVMALAMGAGNAQMQAPQANSALLWAQVLVPGLTQVMGMRYNYLSNVTQSNNAAATAQSTNSTFSNIAGLIQAAPTITNTDRHDVINPAPVITPVVQVVPVVVNPPTVITPVVQITPVFVP